MKAHIIAACFLLALLFLFHEAIPIFSSNPQVIIVIACRRDVPGQEGLIQEVRERIRKLVSQSNALAAGEGRGTNTLSTKEYYFEDEKHRDYCMRTMGISEADLPCIAIAESLSGKTGTLLYKATLAKGDPRPADLFIAELRRQVSWLREDSPALPRPTLPPITPVPAMSATPPSARVIDVMVEIDTRDYHYSSRYGPGRIEIDEHRLREHVKSRLSEQGVVNVVYDRRFAQVVVRYSAYAQEGFVECRVQVQDQQSHGLLYQDGRKVSMPFLIGPGSSDAADRRARDAFVDFLPRVMHTLRNHTSRPR